MEQTEKRLNFFSSQALFTIWGSLHLPIYFMLHHPHLRLSELCERINQTLNQSFRDLNFWVIADVTNHTFRTGKNAHHFELVEKDAVSGNIIARIATKAWGMGAARIMDFEQITGQTFTHNINALLNVSVQYHPIFGLQLNLNDIDPHYTLGILEQQRRATLQKLVTDNPSFIARSGDQYVTKNKLLALPHVIQTIALLSGHTSAGAEDFRHTLLHNSFGYTFSIDDYPTPVQGANNADQLLAKIIEIFQSGKRYDAVVITRGGGSQTDFLIFDHYIIGRAIARFPIPVITGIGHQKNETITDLMAHTQTKTPTKAAEFILAHNKVYEDNLLSFRKNIIIRSQQLFSAHIQSLHQLNNFVVNKTRDSIALHKDHMQIYHQDIIRNARSILFNHKSNLISQTARMLYKPQIAVGKYKSDLEHIMEQIKTVQARHLRNQNNNLHHFQSLIRLMSPENILKKGFAIVISRDKITSNPDEILAGEDIDLILADQQIQVTVKQKSKYDGKALNL